MNEVVVSPCINVCTMDDASGLCQGCLRSIDEIAAWGSLSHAARLAVMRELGQRRKLRDARSNPLQHEDKTP